MQHTILRKKSIKLISESKIYNNIVNIESAIFKSLLNIEKYDFLRKIEFK